MDELPQTLDDLPMLPEHDTKPMLGGALMWKDEPVLADGTHLDDWTEHEHRRLG